MNCNFAQRTELVAAIRRDFIYSYKLLLVQIKFDSGQTLRLIDTTHTVY